MSARGTEAAPPLPPTPAAVLDEAGRPRCGRYAGPISRVDLSRRAGRSRLLDGLRHKRWFYVLLTTERHMVAAAIVDLGYAANGFVYAASVDGGLLAQRASLTAPALVRVGEHPEAGCDARFLSPRLRIELRRPPGATAYRLQVESREISVDAVLETEGAPPPLVAICDLAALGPGGGVNVTEKRALLRSAGVLRVGKQTLPLDDALGGMDYTQGLLPRHTAWYWAFLLGRARDGAAVAVNLVSGWNGEAECGAWVDGALYPLAEAHIHGDRDNPLVPWRVQSRDGRLDLSLQPLGLFEQRQNLLVVRSRFLQPLGRYRGTLALPRRAPLQIDSALGVAEDQDVLW